ncbi:hypothetical protein KMA51_08680 [Enterococcus faecalis]|uniref:hypothetical protein n=1 Tax=Enterococcus faecalis TaxID=1351 RepID=UPI001D0B3C23|nr:hypothetical protein [Enterococcus faecalis]MCB8508407.1 hypothetical protein [Enterococcus faecalis]MCB8511032.1 hypothetical protein [Enterococcus faecalis]
MITEEELRDLNNEVYRVDSNYKDTQTKFKYTDKNMEDLKEFERNEFKTKNGQNFKVLSIKNGAHSFQAMAVAPIVKGQPDVSQVTVVAAGTYPSDENDLKAAAKGLAPNGSPQADEALEYIGTLLETHPDWIITQLTGYSQSAYMLKVGAHFQIATTVFSGWFQYGSLTKAEANFMKGNPHLFLNYRQKNDDVTKWNDFNSHWDNSDDFGTIIWVEGKSHALDSWSFDEKTGQLKIPEKSGNLEGYMRQQGAQIMRHYTAQVTRLTQLKSRLTASGGVLSVNERIYLEDQQALLAVDTGRTAFQNAMTNVMNIYQRAIQEAEELWQNTLKEAYSQTAILSDGEMRECLATAGATQQKIVGEPTEFFQEKINQIRMMAEKFQQLAQEIKQKIQELVQRDRALARQLGT